jgi:hypothetical protein
MRKNSSSKKENFENRKTAWIKIRVTPNEKNLLMQKANELGLSLTDFIRVRTLNYRVRQDPLIKEYLFQLARIGANLNQLATWANIYKSKAEALEVVLALADFEKELHALHHKEE